MKKVNVNISAVNLVNVCVDNGNGTCYGGRLYHRYDESPKKFHNLGELLQLMEKLFDQCGYPQSSTQSRTFGDVHTAPMKTICQPIRDSSELLEQRGEKGSFIIHVKYRHYSTWQGEVVWMEANKKQTFNSALELLKLLDSALES